ncbi:class I SAM-dependent methyltransferase, partial [bacterium]|nr:class I SAM-dependent methyltransferase [bacterium]
MKCRICENLNDNKVYEVQEMMFGLGDKFTYFQCAKCGCLQILEVPTDISQYYPSDYYSFSLAGSNQFTSLIKKLVKKLRDRYAVFNKGVIGKLIYRNFPNEWLRSLFYLQSLSKVNLNRDTKILDVGCGAGSLLETLSQMGFKNLMGIDPYIKEDIKYKNGLKIIKETIGNLDGKWDLIMLHHSFEHISDQMGIFQHIARLLLEGGVCLIVVPTVCSYAWEHYRTKWVQLDAPRHLFLHSNKSIGILAQKAGLNLEKSVYNSTDFQFWGSEQYLKGIPLMSNRSYDVNPSNSIFS